MMLTVSCVDVLGRPGRGNHAEVGLLLGALGEGAGCLGRKAACLAILLLQLLLHDLDAAADLILVEDVQLA
jgi:hypothetical protein